MTSAAASAAHHLQLSILNPMKSAFVGKDLIIDLMGIALASGENLFLLGPPGTAKSALIHHLSRQLGARSFDYLLTRFTEPSELFGPFDIRRLREGDLVTNTSGMLPEAELIFLDELLNANSAILNSLLTILNEHTFRRGSESRPIPALFIAAPATTSQKRNPSAPSSTASCSGFSRCPPRITNSAPSSTPDGKCSPPRHPQHQHRPRRIPSASSSQPSPTSPSTQPAKPA